MSSVEKCTPFLFKSSAPRKRNIGSKCTQWIVLAALVLTAHFFWSNSGLLNTDGEGKEPIICPQSDALYPAKNWEVWTILGENTVTEAFKLRAAELLGGAVRIPTESFDQMDPVGTDPRWEVFGPFHDYLLDAFPLIHTTLVLTKVNTYGLVYLWEGSDPSQKPLLFAAHQDVVPVDPRTVDQWTHPPYSGHFDGQRVWGRGSSDDKGGMIAVMTAIETLLEIGFKPTRSIVLAFGFDEEASGTNGAQSISRHLLSTYGENSFAFIMDEGAGFGKHYGGIFAFPGIAEKGYFDVRVEVSSPGGHSSVPPSHTSIGMLSALIAKYEANPWKTYLIRGSPLHGTFQCLAEHAPDLPYRLRESIKKSVSSDRALRYVEREMFKEDQIKALAGTTVAVDLIKGGVKANALPERAWAVVNHRIAVESSVGVVKAFDTALLKPLASEYNLSYTAFGVDISDKNTSAYGTLTLTDAWDTALEPAPITPTGEDATPFHLLSGTIKAAYNAHRSLSGPDNIAIAPSFMSGNTDTRYYWKLSDHIFRYNHQNTGEGAAISNGIHTVNEFMSIDVFLEMIRFFTTLILNADEATAL